MTEQQDQPADRQQPPHDVAAEQSVLGGMLLSKTAIEDVVDVLRPEDFYRPAHAMIYRAIIDQYGRGEPADPVTTSKALTASGDLLRIGGAPYLHTLISTVPTAANAGYYAEIVAEKAVLREGVEAGTRIVQHAYATDRGQGAATTAEFVARVQAEVYELGADRSRTDYVKVESLLQPFFDELQLVQDGTGTTRGVMTGFADLDRVTNGLQPGQMIIVAARPAIGKSVLAAGDFARHAAIGQGLTTAVFSLEMSRQEIMLRIMSAQAQVRLERMRTGHMTDDDWSNLYRQMGTVAAAPLYVDDSPNMTMPEIRAKARRLKERHDLRLVVVDYLQLMTSGKRVENRQVEVSEFSRSLKLLAKELEVPIVAISQLNRGLEQRSDKTPMLSDLRESGSLEQDADMVLLLHREDAYDKESPRAGEADLILAKHRNGPTATITVAFQGHYSRFVDMAS